MTHSPLTNGIQLTSDSSARSGGIDRFIVHHAATTSLAAILSLFQPGGRTVSANYALGSDGTLILAVDEDRRAWTSSSAHWDGRAVTIEVANSYAGDPWPVSDAAFDKLARLIADVSIRYGFPINDDTVLTHQELYNRYGDSYATACPGDLQRRKAELLQLANRYRSGDTTTTPTRKGNNTMYLNKEVNGTIWLYTENGRAPITKSEHVVLFTRMFNHFPGSDTFNGTELEIMRAYITAARLSSNDDERAILEAIKTISQPDVQIIKDAIRDGLANATVDATVSDEVISKIANTVADVQRARLES